MKSRIRGIIDVYHQGPQNRDPAYVGEGQVFIWPSRTHHDGDYNLVVWMTDGTFACSCRAFRMSGDADWCLHVRDLKGAIEDGKSLLELKVQEGKKK